MKSLILLMFISSSAGVLATPETPSDFRARTISAALKLKAGEPRCLAIAKLFDKQALESRECTTDLDCEAKAEFNKQGCCWNDGLKEPKGC